MRLLDTRLKTVLLFVFAFIIFCLGAISVNSVCLFSLYPDEFGYWATAAQLDGVDFSDVTYLAGTYSFGYGIILWPIFHFFAEACEAYRVAVAVNFVLMMAALIVLTRIVSDITDDNRVVCLMTAAVGAFYAPWIFYSSTTLVESISMFFFVLLVRVYQKYDKTGKLLYGILLVLIAAFMYAFHSRMLVVVIAVAAGLLFRIVALCIEKGASENKNKSVLRLAICIFVLAATVFAVYKVGKYFDALTFKRLPDESLELNEAGAVASRLKFLASHDSRLRTLIGFIGKISYMILASFGLAYYGIKYCFIRIKKDKSGAAIMILTTALLMVLVSTIYLIADSHADSLIYGRYDEFMIPVLMVLGVVQWQQESKRNRLSAVFQTVMICFVGIIGFAMADAGAFKFSISKIRAFMVPAIIAFKHSLGSDSLGLIFASLILAAITVLVSLTFFKITGIDNKRKKSVILSAFLMLMVAGEIILGLYISNKYIFNYSESTREDIALCETIEKVADEGGNIYYLRENNSRFVDALKMQMRYRMIDTISADEIDTISPKDIVITVYNTKYSGELYEMYDSFRIGDLLGIFYNSEMTD